MSDNQKRFEAERQAYFAKHGVELQTRYVKDREGRAICWLENDAAGIPAIFVHGGGANAIVWVSLAAAVAAAGRRVIIVDRPGCGLSYPIVYGEREAYRSQAADFMEDVVTALGVEEVDLIGNSMGGFFALAYALRHPGRVRRMALLGAPAGLDRWLPYPLRFLSLRPLQWLIERAKPMDREGLRKLHAQMLVSHAERLDCEYLDIGCIALPGVLRSWHSLLTVIAGVRGIQIMIREEVATLDVETCFVWGDGDAFAPPSSGSSLAARMPTARLVEVPNAGHLPWLDEPAACADATLAFLEGTAVRQRAA